MDMLRLDPSSLNNFVQKRPVNRGSRSLAVVGEVKYGRWRWRRAEKVEDVNGVKNF